MSDYLTKLKTKKQATEVLPKLPKVPFGSKGSTQVGRFSEKKISGPEDFFQAPAVWTSGTTRDQADQGDHRDSCPVCGESSWWRKNEPNTKWICGRCHPPVSGLDVVYER